MIRKSLTAPNIRRMEQLLKEEDTDSESELSDHSENSEHSDLTSVSSVSSRRSCTCHCQCKIHKKPRRLKKRRQDRPDTNTRRSSFSERSSNFHVKTGISTSVSLSLRDKIRLITLEDHISRHDSSVHGNKECHVCRNILENDSEQDDEMSSSSTSSSPSPASLYTSRSSSSLSSHRKPATPCEKCQESLGEEEKLADIEYLIDSQPTVRTKTAAGCEHRLERKHGGCRVCYQCSLCQEIFLKKISSSSSSESQGGRLRGGTGGQLKIRLSSNKHPDCIIE